MAKPTRIGKQSVDLIRSEGNNSTWTKWWMRTKSIPGLQVGDTLIAVCGLFKTTPETTIIPPKGWVLRINADAMRVYTKTADGNDTWPELVALSGHPELVSFIFYNPKPGGLRLFGEFVETYCYRNAPILDGAAGKRYTPAAGTPVGAHNLPSVRCRYPDQSLLIGGEMSFRFAGPNFGETSIDSMSVVSRDAPQTANTWSWIFADGSIPSGNTMTPANTLHGWSGTYQAFDSYHDWAMCLVANVPPSKPQNRSPANDVRIDLENIGQTFMWAYSSDDNSPQAQIAFRRAVITAGVPGFWQWWNPDTSSWSSSEVWFAQTAQTLTFPTNAWTDGVTYAWSVAAMSSAALSSPYSDYTTMIADTAPLVTVISPETSVGTFKPNIVWDIADPEQDPQVWVETMIVDAAVLNLDSFDFQSPQTTAGQYTIWASGRIITPIQSMPIGVALHNRKTYAAFVRVNNGQTSPWSYQVFTVDLVVPLPPAVIRVTVE